MADITYFWEDMAVGQVRDLGNITPSREDIIAFASQFDPQPVGNVQSARRPGAAHGRLGHVQAKSLCRPRQLNARSRYHLTATHFSPANTGEPPCKLRLTGCARL